MKKEAYLDFWFFDKNLTLWQAMNELVFKASAFYKFKHSYLRCYFCFVY